MLRPAILEAAGVKTSQSCIMDVQCIQCFRCCASEPLARPDFSTLRHAITKLNEWVYLQLFIFVTHTCNDEVYVELFIYYLTPPPLVWWHKVNTKFGIELILCQPPHYGGGAGVSAGPHGGVHHQHGVPGGRDDRGLLQREEEDGEPVVWTLTQVSTHSFPLLLMKTL